MLKRRLILAAGWLLPFVLALLFFLKGRQYDPAFFAPPAVEVVAGPVPAAVGAWRLENGELLSAERMYEKIDGRAEYYLQYGSTSLYSGEWVDGDRRWDMYLYEFSSARGAQGAFAGERPAESTALESLNGYSVPGQVSAVAGTFYLQLGAQQVDAEMVPALQLAVELIRSLGGPAEEPVSSGTGLTPAGLAGERLVPSSEDLLLESAFGFSSLNEVELVRVALDDTDAVWFRAAGGADARTAYAEELALYGGEEIFEQEGGIGGSMFGTWECTGVVDGTLWGVRDAPTKEVLLKHWVAMKAALEKK